MPVLTAYQKAPIQTNQDGVRGIVMLLIICYVLSYGLNGCKFVKVAVNNNDCKIVDSKIFFASNSIGIPYLSNLLL